MEHFLREKDKVRKLGVEKERDFFIKDLTNYRQ